MLYINYPYLTEDIDENKQLARKCQNNNREDLSSEYKTMRTFFC